MNAAKQRTSSRVTGLILFGLALLAGGLAAAYHFGWSPRLSQLLKSETPARSQPPAAPKPVVPGSLKIDDDDQERGGIEAAAPKEIAYQEQVRAYGVILQLDRLVTLYNTAITAAQQLKAAEVKLDASRAANVRAQKLLKVFPTAAAQAEAAQAAERIDAAAVESAKAQIEVIKNTGVLEWGPVLGGGITTRSALLESLVDRRACLVQVTLQSGSAAEAPVSLDITLGSGRTEKAALVSAATQAGPKINSASYFYVMPVAPGTLAGATVSASLPKGEPKPSIVIPPSAVVWMAGKPWFYVKTSAETFERKAIDADAVAAADGGYVVPKSRWPGDRPIVVAGAQALLSEETKSQRADEDND